MKSILIGIFTLGSSLAIADGSSVSVTPNELRAESNHASAVVRTQELSAKLHRPSHGGSKVTANENTNLGIVNKSKVNKSTIGMKVHAE